MSPSGMPGPGYGSSFELSGHIWLAVLVLFLSLTGCSKGVSPPATSSSEDLSPTNGTATAPPSASLAAGEGASKDEPGGLEPWLSDEYPVDALDLLTQSTQDSCSVCAEKNRKKAFALLDEFYPPGDIISASGDRRLLRVPGGLQELQFSSYVREQPRLTFRFHTDAEHLVGIDPADYTDRVSVTAYEVAGVEAAPLVGTLQVVAYAYGDGPSYLYFPSENHLQVQCRLLDLSRE